VPRNKSRNKIKFEEGIKEKEQAEEKIIGIEK
jgi:hypothetical protein